MIWMGVGRPGDFVAPLNRFPIHNQRLVTHANTRFVARSNCLVPLDWSCAHRETHFKRAAKPIAEKFPIIFLAEPNSFVV